MKRIVGMTIPDGVIVFNKPRGITSKDVSRAIERRYGKQKLGHAGTLDPLAEGVLPLLFGKATRLQDFLVSGFKVYEFSVDFGYLTDTLDTDGQIIERDESGFVAERSAVEKAVADLMGTWNQVPPAYSAVKYKGRPLYDYARSGRIDLVPIQDLGKTITVESLECLELCGGSGVFRVKCSKGTYVRGLADSLARHIGTIGTVTSIKRLESAGFRWEQALPFDMVEDSSTDLRSHVLPVSRIPLNVPTLTMTDVERSKLQRGQKVVVDERLSEGVAQMRWVSENKSLDMVLVLKSLGGELFGIGQLKKTMAGHQMLSMKRGLV